MKKQKPKNTPTPPRPLRIIFLQGDYPAEPKYNPFFSRGAILHKFVESTLQTKICWHFVGSFIEDSRLDFWSKIKNADAIFTSSLNMNHEDINFHWSHASESMNAVLKKIKTINPKIKIIFYSWDSEMASDLEKYGKLILDLHDAAEIKASLK